MPKITSWNVNGLKSLCSTYGSLEKALSHLQSDIICFQETKLASASALRSEICISDNYFSYFAICRHSNRHEKAYSGTATFVRKMLPVLRAQEGLTGRSTTKDSDQDRDDRIVQVLASEVNLTEEELQLLDSEGRCVITDHGDFVLFNIYAPNAYSSNSVAATVASAGDTAENLDSKWEISFETDVTDITDRFVFKMKFHYLLSFCINKLQAEGKRVIVVGDLNTTSTRLDHCEPGNHDFNEPFEASPRRTERSPGTSNDYWKYTFESRPQVLWMKNVLSSHPCYIIEDTQEGRCGNHKNYKYHSNPLLTLFSEYIDTALNLVDTFRHHWPTRENAFTCWNTLTGARKTNFGTRLDYVLVSRALLDDVVFADIEPLVLGSDHCPVHCSLKSSLCEVENGSGKSNPPPSLCSIYIHSSVQTSLTSFLCTNANKVSSTIRNEDRSARKPPATLSAAKRSTVAKKNPNPMSVAIMESLFRKNPLPCASSAGDLEKRNKRERIEPPATISSLLTHDNVADNVVEITEIVDDSSETKNSLGLKRHKSNSNYIHSDESVSSSSTTPTTPHPTALSSFKALFQKPTVPKCCHDEECVIRTVVKSGPSEGRR